MEAITILVLHYIQQFMFYSLKALPLFGAAAHVKCIKHFSIWPRPDLFMKTYIIYPRSDLIHEATFTNCQRDLN